MAGQSLQASRYEYKYYVDEARASAIRRFVESYLEPDEFLIRFGGIGYPVCSLYLDNSGLLLYDQTIQGQKNRFKLRIRFYDDNAENPAFLEIKRRETDVIKKKRCAVTRDGARRVIMGELPSMGFLFGNKVTTKNLDALHEFCLLRDRVSATGCTYVYYHRQAYVSPDSSAVRVTFDRQIEGGVYTPGTDLAIPIDSARPKMEGVVLELKFTDRFPNWMERLAEDFNLQRTSVPKYVKCVDALRERDPSWARPWRPSI
ncbi:MAG: polyphosphate polymerase domain-containing protein [Planctomycetales bacterium]|nr:polyphosphate polymerase domain-containing protein [Planctomycetales bacterium]MCA9171054.1 polyphosphate polymerase domain-containing protein [Planctomycetales bacterium]